VARTLPWSLLSLMTDQNAIGVVPGGPDAVEVMVPGFQGIEGDPGATGPAGPATGFFVVAHVAALPGSPVVGNTYLVLNSTNVQGIAGLLALPGGFVGSTSLWVQLIRDATGPAWRFVTYGAIDPDARYAPKLSQVHVGISPPANPAIQPFWFDTTEGRLKLQFDDGGGLDWVEASPPAAAPAAQSVPPGVMAMDAAPTPPAGWLACNGQLVSRVTYAALFARIGTTHGAGDGSTTFALPDYRGLFPRGHSYDGAIDAGRVFGSFQDQETESHTNAVVSGSANVALGQYPISTVSSATVGGVETRPPNRSCGIIIKT
jgi:hypothetical protein